MSACGSIASLQHCSCAWSLRGGGRFPIFHLCNQRCMTCSRSTGALFYSLLAIPCTLVQLPISSNIFDRMLSLSFYSAHLAQTLFVQKLPFHMERAFTLHSEGARRRWISRFSVHCKSQLHFHSRSQVVTREDKFGKVPSSVQHTSEFPQLHFTCEEKLSLATTSSDKFLRQHTSEVVTARTSRHRKRNYFLNARVTEPKSPSLGLHNTNALLNEKNRNSEGKLEMKNRN